MSRIRVKRKNVHYGNTVLLITILQFLFFVFIMSTCNKTANSKTNGSHASTFTGRLLKEMNMAG